ncbi:hypothetical protein FOXB_02123 [Fusarium oxysporum f. sp. conglutinans Fo5176]|uniref:Uncharacterized protein n=1 Tax=Fusarium oxysporum (strain Fo5176) TaxID=660025 RepID=F9F6U8_FUSOF|nr:hypothetical protein FOXB_02123 [Fusarium oxysporum f. sp. conglutinans Fo5176]
MASLIASAASTLLVKFGAGLAGKAGGWVFQEGLAAVTGGTDTEKVRQDIANMRIVFAKLKDCKSGLTIAFELVRMMFLDILTRSATSSTSKARMPFSNRLHSKRSINPMIFLDITVRPKSCLLQMAHDTPQVNVEEGSFTIDRHKANVLAQEQNFQDTVGEATIALAEGVINDPTDTQALIWRTAAGTYIEAYNSPYMNFVSSNRP